MIVFATGSNVAEHGLGLNIGLYGEGGIELRSYWKSIEGPQSYLGLSVPKFPNYFMVVGPNAIAGSWGYTIGNQVSEAIPNAADPRPQSRRCTTTISVRYSLVKMSFTHTTSLSNNSSRTAYVTRVYAYLMT
jgi:cation diffusion facilitator CzcD-associated flavoprotein CzcO